MSESKRPDVVALIEPLRRYARALTRDEGRAEDLVQDTLVRAYERHGTFRSGGNLRAWLLSILHNVFVDERRRHRAEARRVEEAARDAELTGPAAPSDPESRVRLAQIQEAFLALPEEQRAALHLVAVEGLSYQEAAAALGVPVGTLMSRLGRGRASLRAFEEGRGRDAAGKPRPSLRIVGGADE
ncbi:MAG TPA: sigma-70 family RNA polymerase sigma factor [Microvirga sp.]|jgi:RNA polymerase sigma-70 factor (ECF subfamily)|nr:sigma-70 family RNA polymerase sigma factor [Microvirga sp.]